MSLFEHGVMSMSGLSQKQLRKKMENKGEVNKGREEANQCSTEEHRKKSTEGEQQEEGKNAEEGNCLE